MDGKITTTEAAARLGVTVGRVRALVSEGRLSAVKEDRSPWGAVLWLDPGEVAGFTRRGPGRPRKPAAPSAPERAAHARRGPGRVREGANDDD